MIYQRLLDEVRLDHYRFLYHEIKLSSRIIGIIGARGVGKTTMMLQIIKNQFSNNTAFYFSADHIYFESITLYEFIEDLYLTDRIETFFIDEIHKYKNWNQELKNIYDGFPSIKIVFSGSSSIDLIKGSYDLSRRAKLYHLPGMSFREYLNFNTKNKIDSISFENLMKNHQKYDKILSNIPKLKGYFNDYIRYGYYPFKSDDPLNYHEKLLTVIDKTIYEDIANFYNLKTANLHNFKKILNFLTNVSSSTLSVHNIAKNLSIDDKTVMNYLLNLKETGLINLIYPCEGGNQGLRRPEKTFLSNTNLQYAIEGVINSKIKIGTIRELFFIQSIINCGKQIFHSKTGDYFVDNFIFEIGGKNKTHKQIKGHQKAFLVKDETLTSRKTEIPLIFFGFLY